MLLFFLRSTIFWWCLRSVALYFIIRWFHSFYFRVFAKLTFSLLKWSPSFHQILSFIILFQVAYCLLQNQWSKSWHFIIQDILTIILAIIVPCCLIIFWLFNKFYFLIHIAISEQLFLPFLISKDQLEIIKHHHHDLYWFTCIHDIFNWSLFCPH